MIIIRIHCFWMEAGGYTAADDIKPDFVAPGVDVYGPGRAGTFVRKTGTSVAAAHCAGCAALILQWARDRDLARFVNGNQIRNYFIRGSSSSGNGRKSVFICHERYRGISVCKGISEPGVGLWNPECV